MNPTMESTTSPKTQEPSRPPPSHGSSLSSSPNQKPDVLYSPSVPGTGPRPSIRLDSKPKVPDENSSTKSVSGGRCRGKGIAEENVVDLTAETDSSSDSDSEDLNGKGKGKLVAGVLDSRRKRRRILDFNLPALDLEVEDGNDNGFLNLQSGFDSEQLALPEREDRESREWLTDGSRKGVDVENLERDPIGDAETRYRSEGEENLTGIDQLLAASALLDAEQLENAKKHAAMIARIKMSRRRYFKEQILNDSLRNASRFAQFQPEGKEYHSVSPVPERGMPSVEADEEIKDLSSPFSTAMRIVKGRMMKLNDSQENTSSGVSKSVPVIEWMPSNNQCHNHSKPSVPSLQALCLSTLAKNSNVIVSLKFVPDMLKHKLSQLVCDSQRMDCRFMDLLVSGCPTEIRVKNCSGITEEQLRRTLEGCSTQNLTVLQLDLSGRCMSDYIISANLAWSQNSLPALATISLRGACRLSDVGLNALVASAPALRYINLGQCSLLTSTGINNLADSLGSVLRELCIDDCQNIDAMLILPALKKLEHLEVLSVARVHNVCDDFVSELVVICGPNMKKLVFSDCRELTNTSLKVIAETCSRLCALDLVNLYKLTDCAIQYLANGCQSIQTFKLCRNSFSDEAIAAFLETSGASLTEFSLNNVRKVGDNTAISLAKRSRKLLNLDLSFCRNLTNEALGLIVDSCLSLKVLKLFGCTQITDVFLDGHSNPLVQIIGLKMTPIVEHLNILEP